MEPSEETEGLGEATLLFLFRSLSSAGATVAGCRRREEAVMTEYRQEFDS